MARAPPLAFRIYTAEVQKARGAERAKVETVAVVERPLDLPVLFINALKLWGIIEKYKYA